MIENKKEYSPVFLKISFKNFLHQKLLKQHLIRATGSAYIMLLSLSCQEKRKQKRIFAALKGPKSNINGIKNGINHLRFCNVDSLAIRSCNKYCMLVRYSYFPSLFFFIPSLCMHTHVHIYPPPYLQ